eukprot:scaffold215166_cov56-Attheya_sp.AAC.2
MDIKKILTVLSKPPSPPASILDCITLVTIVSPSPPTPPPSPSRYRALATASDSGTLIDSLGTPPLGYGILLRAWCRLFHSPS